LVAAFLILPVSSWVQANSGDKTPDDTIAFASAHQGEGEKQPDKRPNILLIVADDMGWSDISPFGSEIRTPHLQRMADEGVSFTQFYVAPACSPTRSMLMSGADNHRAGMGTNAEVIAPNQTGNPGYEGYLNERAASVASTLNNSGYETFMAGKWHLGHEPEHWPIRRGFERSFSLMQGGASHFGDQAPMCNKYYPIYVENDRRTSVPDDFYSSTFYAEKMIEYIETRDGSKPFFGYLAFTAVHDPLHVPDNWLHAYGGRYNEGPEALRKERLARQMAMGLVPEDIKLWEMPNPPEGSPGHEPEWRDRPDEVRAYSARMMEIYASMVELMDHEIGRLLNYLRSIDEYDNTYVIFFSDNGANGSPMHSYPDTDEEWLALNSDNRYENLGRKGSREAYGFEWAVTSNTPWRLIKGMITDGGIRSPLVVNGPGIPTGKRSEALLHIMDMAPTFLDIAGATHPAKIEGNKILPMQGKSMLTCWGDVNATVRSDQDILGWELIGFRAIRAGNWKAIWLPPPLGSGDWQLYDLKNDPGESEDLSGQYPDKLKKMIEMYEDYSVRNGVILPDPPFTFSP
jgi:arylsulfatase